MKSRPRCRTQVSPDTFYEDLTTIGLAYGRKFANVSSLNICANQSSVVVDIPDLGLDDVQSTKRRPHVIHPALLDAVFHSIFAAILSSGELKSAMIPKTIDSIIVSADTPFHADEKLSGVCETRKHGLKEYMADIVMENPKNRLPTVMVQGLCCSKIAGDTAIDGATIENSLCTEPLWKPHLGLMNDNQLSQILSDGEASVWAKLSEFISLTHHAHCSGKIIEIAANDNVILPRLSIDSEVCTTTSYHIAYLEQAKSTIEAYVSDQKPKGLRMLMDIAGYLSNADTICDVLIALYDGSEKFEAAIQKAARRLSANGVICIVQRTDTQPISHAGLGVRAK